MCVAASPELVLALGNCNAKWTNSCGCLCVCQPASSPNMTTKQISESSADKRGTMSNRLWERPAYSSRVYTGDQCQWAQIGPFFPPSIVSKRSHTAAKAGEVLTFFFFFFFFDLATPVLLISGRAWCSAAEPIDPKRPRMVVLSVIHQTGPVFLSAHSCNSLKRISRCSRRALYSIQAHFCGTAAVFFFFFLYQSNLLHHFALLDLFSALFPLRRGICIPITAHSAGSAWLRNVMNDMLFFSPLHSCPLTSHSLYKYFDSDTSTCSGLATILYTHFI